MKLGLTQLLPKAPPTTDPRGWLLYDLPVGSGFTLRVKVWCCWGGLNSRPRHYQSKGRTTRKYGYLRFSGNRTWAFANDPRQTQTVRSCCLGGFLLKVLWSNEIGKSDLRRTYGPLVMDRERTVASLRGSIHSCRLGRSERLAVAVNIPAFRLAFCVLQNLSFVRRPQRGQPCCGELTVRF